MSLKEFLKPNNKKIVLTVVFLAIFLTALFAPIIKKTVPVFCALDETCYVTSATSVYEEYFDFLNFYFYISVIISVYFVSYLFSCFTIRIYNKKRR